MNHTDYCTGQSIVVVETEEVANAVTLELGSSEVIIGFDCEWNGNKGSKISLIQIATFSKVLLFRLSKFERWVLPDALRTVLECQKIVKLGVNIENDAKKLRNQFQCNLRGWVDLRSIAACQTAYGKVLAQKLRSFEDELSLVYNEYLEENTEAENLEQKNMKKMMRYNWKPKLGLGSLSEDCLGLRLQKTSSARWKDDWEADTLTKKQVTYAAADSAVALDIFLALCSKQTLGSPVNIAECDVSVETLQTYIDEHCSRYIECPVKQKSIDKLCFALVTSVDKRFDLTEYLTKTATKIKDKKGINQEAKKAKLADITTMKEPHRMISNKPLYENCKLYAPDNTLLCTCDKKKIEWYLNKNLALPVEQPDGKPIAAKLIFDPSGKPKDSSDFYCQDKVNQCCCCAQTDKLVKKNVIPKEYRKHLAEQFKNRQSHDVVLLCVRCHCASNSFDNLLREELATQYGIPVNYKNSFTVVNEAKLRVRSAASALTSGKRDMIPEERRTELRQTIAEYLGHEPSELELEELRNISKNAVRTVSNGVTDHGTEVVRRVVEEALEEEFIVRWRNFFLSSMKPKYLPMGWSVWHRTRDMECGEEGEVEDVGGSKEGSLK